MEQLFDDSSEIDGYRMNLISAVRPDFIKAASEKYDGDDFQELAWENIQFFEENQITLKVKVE